MALLLVPMSIFAQKFGHFDSSAIIQLMPEYTTAQTEIQQLQAQYENDLKRMQDELKKKSEEYEKEKANLLDNVRQRRETELQDLYNRIQQSYQDNQKSLQETSQQDVEYGCDGRHQAKVGLEISGIFPVFIQRLLRQYEMPAGGAFLFSIVFFCFPIKKDCFLSV